jgi:WD40 repeat protein
MQQISALIGNIPASEDDLTSLLDRWRPGTCEATFSHEKYIDWRYSSTGSKILWAHAQPGSGKSVKSAVQIKHMREFGKICIYFFFKFGDSTKRSPGSLLRSLVFQLAQEVPAFRRALLLMRDNRIKVEKMEARLLWERIFVGTLFKLELEEPLYFVIDALDESDSVNTIVGFLSTISNSRTPLRVLITSRKTSEISMAFERISSVTSVDSVSIADNIDDIRLYATTEMEYMHGSPEFRYEIVNEIVRRAEGNFLWVHLALKDIMRCHSPDDVREVLSEIPPGMEAIYKRMEEAISRLSRASDITLARHILSWATYARRPLDTEELMRALQPEMPSIIDLQFTISQVCGNFVVVDHNNRVTLIHQTAREYLIKNAQLPFSLATKEVQEELFCRTLGVFLDTQIRSKMNQNPLPSFYDYAATSWAYHLSRSSAGSDVSLTLLVKFLGATPVIYWIRILASLGQLKVLVTASTILRSFAEKRRKLDSTIRPTLHRLTDLELLESWATDLLKLVGKFGSHLIQDPTAIQKSIPQFCPRNSTIFRQFGKQAHVSVKGLSNDDWDDCLARVSIASGHQAMNVICSTRHIAVLTTSGTIVLWDSVTFEETRSIAHQEHIFAMCFSNDGQILASYGVYTTRIWNASTGRQLHKIANLPDSRALCISFVEDSTNLLVGLSSRKVAELSLEGESNSWSVINSSFLQEDTSPDGAYLNAPTSIAFNSDGTYVAVAYRGFPLAVWSIIEKKRIKRCWRESKNDHRPGDAWSGVNKVMWHPNNEEVIGLYTDGTVFKWNPFEEVHEELQADLYGAPSEIQCSPNGLVFATSDVNGIVKLYNYEYFSLIYQLSSEDIITSICFSPDSRRFCDIRGSYCNIWEPNALFRLPDTDEHGSEIDTESGSITISHHPSEVRAEMPIPVTALAPRPQGGMFCTGNEEGLAELYEISTLKPIQAGNSRGKMNIEFIEWADDGDHFAYSDGDMISIKKIRKPTKDLKPSDWSFQSIMDISVDLDGGKIHQILLSPDASFVMVVDSDTSQLWSSPNKNPCKTLKVQGLQKWANHPLEPQQVLAFTPDCITSYTWVNLEIISQWQINTPTPLFPSAPKSPTRIERPDLSRHGSSGFSELDLEVHEYVDEVSISYSREYALVLISQQVGLHARPWSHLQILEMSSLQDTEASNIDPVAVPEDIMAAIFRPLGVLGKDQLVFLDKSFWVCSWRLLSTGGLSNLVKHFFLPRDWISLEILRLCRILADGTFLCPRKGQVAVIRSSLGRNW